MCAEVVLNCCDIGQVCNVSLSNFVAKIVWYSEKMELTFGGGKKTHWLFYSANKMQFGAVVDKILNAILTAYNVDHFHFNYTIKPYFA